MNDLAQWKHSIDAMSVTSSELYDLCANRLSSIRNIEASELTQNDILSFWNSLTRFSHYSETLNTYLA